MLIRLNCVTSSVVVILLSTICNFVSAGPSLKDYAALPEIQNIAISPSGNLIAFRKLTPEFDRVIVTSLITHQQVSAIAVDAIKPQRLYFLNEDQLVLIASDSKRFYGVRDEKEISAAFLLDFKNNAQRQLLIPGDDPLFLRQSGLGRVVGVSPDGAYAYMPAFVNSKNSRIPDYSLLKVNLKEKAPSSIISKGVADAADFFVDANGSVVAQITYNSSSNVYRVRARKNDEWADIFKEKFEIPGQFFGLTQDYKSIIKVDTDADTGFGAFYAMSLTDGSLSRPMFGRDDADIDGVLTDDQRIVLGVRYSGFRPSYQFFDTSLNQRMKDIAATFPDHSVFLVSHTPDLKNIVVRVEGANVPCDYYLFAENKPAQFLTSSRPKIRVEDLHPMGTVTFTARDGLKIPTLLTIPKTKANAMKNLPAVIMPHGGPAAHDSMRFNPMAQALAENGYLVIQPQFRGSAGFGVKHREAGYGEWGKKMQDDITDAVNFAVKKGLVDPAKVCIVGASYGGYAALAGGAFTPDIYTCVVSMAGIGNLKSMFTWGKSEYGRNSSVVSYMKKQFTNGEADTQAMLAVSPEEFATNFKVPVLLIHGVDDERVPFEQSEAMHKALKKANKEVTLVQLKDEGHSFIHTETRLAAFEETIKFVNKHIGQ